MIKRASDSVMPVNRAIANPIRVTSRPKTRNMGMVGKTYQKVSMANSAIRLLGMPSARIQTKADVATKGRAARRAAHR